ncbi:MAG TPA: hypothetical protein VHZ06_02535 [Marmoricola sp.]|jgi:hypothetical protein|nr:hypothetical protein [Marmoricola sp.]
MADQDGTVLIARAALVELEDLAQEAALPHLVICTDVGGGAQSYSGPYPTREEALAAARYEARLEDPDEERLRFTVEPVFPPIRHHLVVPAQSTGRD